MTIEKHKMLPVFPGRSLDGGCGKVLGNAEVPAKTCWCHCVGRKSGDRHARRIAGMPLDGKWCQQRFSVTLASIGVFLKQLCAGATVWGENRAIGMLGVSPACNLTENDVSSDFQ
jgi:hypothetical protein